MTLWHHVPSSSGETYAIQNGEWSICKIFQDGVPSYELWRGKAFYARAMDAEKLKVYHRKLTDTPPQSPSLPLR